MVGFDVRLYTVGEQDGLVELCVNVTMPRRQDIDTVTFNLTVETQDGSAGIANRRSIYFISLIVVNGVTFIRTESCICVPIHFIISYIYISDYIYLV